MSIDYQQFLTDFTEDAIDVNNWRSIPQMDISQITEKAICFESNNSYTQNKIYSKYIWIPKSQFRIVKGDFQITTWLYNKKFN